MMKFKSRKSFGTYELEINDNGWFYQVIYGMSTSGWFVCIPNWRISAPISSPVMVDINTKEIDRAFCNNQLASNRARIIAETLFEDYSKRIEVVKDLLGKKVV